MENKLPIVNPVPFDSNCGYFKRVIHWLFYTRKWEMVEDWYFVLFNGDMILIPKGFQFDGASIPKLFRFLLSPTGILFIPGIIHDYAYKHNKLVGVVFREEDGKIFLYPYQAGAGKAFWDWVFMRTTLQVCNLPIIAWTTYATLSFFGFLAWYRHRHGRAKNYN